MGRSFYVIFFFVCVEIVCYTLLPVEDLSIDTFHNIQSLQRLVNCEKVEVHDVSHSLVALSIGVEIVVLEEVLGIHAEGVLLVAHGMLHLDDTIQQGSGAHPVVQVLASGFVVLGVVTVVLERSDGATEHIDTFGMGFVDNLRERLSPPQC